MIDISLPEGFEWCRKRKYNVQVELACYPITENQPLIDGFEEKAFNIDGILKKYAMVKCYKLVPLFCKLCPNFSAPRLDRAPPACYNSERRRPCRIFVPGSKIPINTALPPRARHAPFFPRSYPPSLSF